MIYCNRCGKPSTISINGQCPDCFYENNHYNYYYSNLTNYQYKCPVCQGEFNIPAVDDTPGTTSSYYTGRNPRCPFCGNPMKGLE